MKQIEDAFKEFTTREDIAIVLISQYVSFYSILPLVLSVYIASFQLLAITFSWRVLNSNYHVSAYWRGMIG